jgi:hypothetical protein
MTAALRTVPAIDKSADDMGGCCFANASRRVLTPLIWSTSFRSASRNLGIVLQPRFLLRSALLSLADGNASGRLRTESSAPRVLCVCLKQPYLIRGGLVQYFCGTASCDEPGCWKISQVSPPACPLDPVHLRVRVSLGFGFRCRSAPQLSCSRSRSHSCKNSWPRGATDAAEIHSAMRNCSVSSA